MECEEIKKIIPKYFKHTASDEEIQSVEEHLCVCHDCRTVLGELMDKASETEEPATTEIKKEIPSQEQPESLPEEKSQGDAEKNKEETVSAAEDKEIDEKQQEEAPVVQEEIKLKPEDKTEKKDGMEYFPGEDLEVSMNKVDDILENLEPAKGDSGDKPEKLESVVEDKEEEKGELPIEEEKDSSFEVILDSSAPIQEPPAESGSETSGTKDIEFVTEGNKGLEEKVEPVKEKVEFSIEEEKIEEKASPSLEEAKEEPLKEKTEEKIVFSFEEEKKEEAKEEEPEITLEKEPEASSEDQVKEKEEALDFSSGTGIGLKEEESEKPALKEKVSMVSLEETNDNQESLEEVSYSLDGAPLAKGNVSLFDYLCLIAGLGVLGFLAYLLLKG